MLADFILNTNEILWKRKCLSQRQHGDNSIYSEIDNNVTIIMQHWDVPYYDTHAQTAFGQDMLYLEAAG